MYMNLVVGFANIILFNLVNSVGFDISYPTKNTMVCLRYTANIKLKVCVEHFSGSMS